MVPCRGVPLLVLFLCRAVPAAGQATGTIGVGASYIEYDGFLSTTAAVLAPAFRFDTPRLSFGSQASWTAFESGNGVVQANAAAAWLTTARGRWRLELSGAAGGSKYASEPSSGHLIGGARLHLLGEQGGGWLGISGGRLLGSPALTPVELTVAGWRVAGRVTLVGTVTTAALGQARHLDLLGALRWTGSRVELEARLGARPWVRSAGVAGDAITGGYGDATVTFSLGPRVGLALSAGSYPSDPVRRLLGARYLSAGIRVRALGVGTAPSPLLVPPARLRGSEAAADETRLEILGSGEVRTVRVRAPGRRSVELRGDFTDWEPIAMTEVGAGNWETSRPIPAGVHRIAVRFDGGPWLAPPGTRAERTEFGDLVGIIVVP
jgi:hypothetical protein